MTYQTPELLLVGAAQGLVLGTKRNGAVDDNLSQGPCEVLQSRIAEFC